MISEEAKKNGERVRTPLSPKVVCSATPTHQCLEELMLLTPEYLTYTSTKAENSRLRDHQKVGVERKSLRLRYHTQDVTGLLLVTSKVLL